VSYKRRVRAVPTQAWILAGRLDGIDARPELREDVCGMPHVLRLALDLAHAGARRIVVVWSGDGLPSIDDIAIDPRLEGAELTIATTTPAGPDEAVLIVRADRIFHREMPKLAVEAWRTSVTPFANVRGDDAIIVTTRAKAEALAAAVREHGAFTDGVADEIASAEPPYLAFTARASDRKALRRAERTMVWSLRKQAQGLAAYWINRHMSLPVTRAIMRTSILPNHITVFCFLLAVAGAIVISRGGYLAGVIGMVLVNLGSILDGVDGELARLKYRFSRLGAWLDTLADDLGNFAYSWGVAISLDKAGVTWAVPLTAIAMVCFALTQTTQYWLIAKVYKSGDLAAIPWALQSNEFLASRPRGFVARVKATVPKMLKRDFALTMFVVFALVGRLDAILIVYSAGAIGFFAAFAVQFFRNVGSLKRPTPG
jgi:phosphatidylglycerophosphate synthase